MGFAVIAVINGIFIQETFKVAACDDTLMLMQKERAIAVHTKKMNKLFKAADDNTDGVVSLDELKAILEEDSVRNWLAAQDLMASDADVLFDLLRHPDEHGITALSLVKGVAALKGAARSI